MILQPARQSPPASERPAADAATGTSAEVPRPLPVPVAPQPRLAIPLASLVCLALVPLVLVLVWRRRAGAAAYLATAGAGALLAAALWPVGQLEVPDPFATAAPPPAAEARRIFQRLHRNIYTAFTAREESAIYDALATSVDGPLLPELYLHVRRGLELEEEGGAVTRVRAVTILEGQPEKLPAGGSPGDPRAFRYDCRWTVAGIVRHWGHVHERTNEYQAQFTVEPRDGAWKITAVELWDEQRGELQTTPTGPGGGEEEVLFDK